MEPDPANLALGEFIFRLICFTAGAVIGGFLVGCAVWAHCAVQIAAWRAEFEREHRLRMDAEHPGTLAQPRRANPARKTFWRARV